MFGFSLIQVIVFELFLSLPDIHVTLLVVWFVVYYDLRCSAGDSAWYTGLIIFKIISNSIRSYVYTRCNSITHPI